MTLLSDEAAMAVRNVRAARESAQEQLARGRARLRAPSKTRKSAATRQRIMDAAVELMAEYGDTSFQMSAVSARCHLSKGSLYYYFADKDELVQAVFAETIDETVAAMERVVANAPTAHDALSGLCAEFARRVGSGGPLALALTSELSSRRGDVLGMATTNLSRAVALVATQLERAKSEGVVRTEVDASLAAAYVVGGFLMTSIGLSALGTPVTGDALVEELMGITLAGIGVVGRREADGGQAA